MIGDKLVLITNRKSYMSFQLVPKSVTLNDPERRNGPNTALFPATTADKTATFMVFGVQYRNPTFRNPLFCTVNTDRPLSCDEEHRPVAEFMCKSIVFCSTCAMLS